MIKIERPDGGDFARRYDDFVAGESSHFVWLNRGKRSVALDLKSASGPLVLRRLLSNADVFVTNLTPSAAERLVDDERLASELPRLVRCYISGYGASGPMRGRKTFDLLIQGEAGITRATGTSESPAKCGVSLVDLAAGVYAFGAVSAALFERSASGLGRRIDLALFDVAAEWMMPLLLAQQFAGRAPEPRGLHHATIAPYGAFRTKDDVLVNIAVQNEDQWRRLCDALGIAELSADPRFATGRQRFESREAVDAIVAGRVATLMSGELIQELERRDVPWGHVNTVDQVLQHQRLTAPERWIPAFLPNGDGVTLLGDPIQVNGRFGGQGAVPQLGQHTVDVLHEVGFSSDEISDLRTEGALGTSPA